MPARRHRSPQSRSHPFVQARGLATTLPAAGAEIVLYERDSFRGRSFVSVSSGRRIHDQYPCNQNPAWPR